MPTRNWSEGTFEGAENINSESFQKIRIKKRACYQCAIACRNVQAEVDGKTVTGEGPEYETIALCGANCGIGDIAALVEVQRAVRRAGAWTPSPSGSVVGLAMDLTEKGIKDFGVRFGDVESYLKRARAHRDARRRRRRAGAGRPRALAEKYGVPELAMEVKNLELPGYDPRGSFGMSVALRHLRPRRLPHAHLSGRRRDHRRHDARRHHGGQGRQIV